MVLRVDDVRTASVMNWDWDSEVGTWAKRCTRPAHLSRSRRDSTRPHRAYSGSREASEVAAPTDTETDTRENRASMNSRMGGLMEANRLQTTGTTGHRLGNTHARAFEVLITLRAHK